MKKDDLGTTHDPLRSKARLALGTAGTLLVGMGIASGLGWTNIVMPDVDEEPRVSEAAVKPALDLSDAFVNVAQVVTPAVVRIEALRPGQRMARGEAVPAPFRQFFRDEEETEPGEPMPQLGGGSGFLISDDGYILTNDHVVNGANQITVFLADRRKFEARLVGTDPFTDVAVIKIEADETLATLSFGDSDEIRVGEWVMAVGNPGFGAGSGATLDYSVTAGIVSARGRGLQLLDRELFNDERTRDLRSYAIEDFIQTDAVINPGNSGGPMVDLQGRVIGINSAIASSSGFYQGYGFAVPINLARRVMEDLVEYGHVKRPMIGVSIRDVTPEAADAYELPSVSGAIVQDVTGEPARRAGIRSEDVIVAVDGKPVGYSNQLQQRVAAFRPGETVTVSLYRDGRPMEVEVRLGEAPLSDIAVPVAEVERAAEDRLGFAVEPLDAATAERLSLEPGGVYISDVRPLSPAFRQNLRAGYKLTAIDDEEIEAPSDVREVLEDVDPGEVVTLHLVLPGGSPALMHVRMPGG